MKFAKKASTFHKILIFSDLETLYLEAGGKLMYNDAMFDSRNGFPGETKAKEGDAGEDDPATSDQVIAPAEAMHRELRDGPMPAPAVIKGASLALDKLLLSEFGGDPERDIHSNIMLSEN